jgi:hypothetical protein
MDIQSQPFRTIDEILNDVKTLPIKAKKALAKICRAGVLDGEGHKEIEALKQTVLRDRVAPAAPRRLERPEGFGKPAREGVGK